MQSTRIYKMTFSKGEVIAALKAKYGAGNIELQAVPDAGGDSVRLALSDKPQALVLTLTKDTAN
jgi:hypothetical protein